MNASTFGSMTALFDGGIGAFAYLLMVLLYIPCVAAIAAIYRETNLRWTVFSCAWNAFLAYAASALFYQIATFGRHPGNFSGVGCGDRDFQRAGGGGDVADGPEKNCGAPSGGGSSGIGGEACLRKSNAIFRSTGRPPWRICPPGLIRSRISCAA